MKTTPTEIPEYTQLVSKASSMIPQLTRKELDEIIIAMEKMLSEREQDSAPLQ